MNHSVLDVLMYLFETFSEQEHDEATDHGVLRQELLQAGFGEPEVDRALDLARRPESRSGAPVSRRRRQTAPSGSSIPWNFRASIPSAAGT